MAVCRSPSPLNPVDVKLRVSRQFVFGIGAFLKDGGLTVNDAPGGGFRYLLCSPLFGEMMQSDYTNILQRGWNHQLV